MRRSIFVIALSVSMLVANGVWAEEISKDPGNGLSVQSTSPEGQSSERLREAATLSLEVAELRGQNEVLKSFTENTLSTIYWSLGTTVGILIVLAGASWWTNNKLLDHDKKALKAEFERSLATFKEETALAVKMAVAEAAAVESASFEAKLKGFAEQLTSLSGGAGNMEKRLQRKMDIIVGQVGVEFDFLHAEAWVAKGVFTNAFNAYTSALRTIAEDLDLDSYDAVKCLDALKAVCTAAEQKDYKFHTSDIARLKTLLPKMPAQYAISVSAIEELLRKVSR